MFKEYYLDLQILNSKLKLIVKTLGYIIYSITPLHMRAFCAWSVDAMYAFSYHQRIKSTKVKLIRFELVIILSLLLLNIDIIPRDQLNQQVKLMVEASSVYSNKFNKHSIMAFHSSWLYEYGLLSLSLEWCPTIRIISQGTNSIKSLSKW